MTIANALFSLILYPIIQVIELTFLIFEKVFDNIGVSVLGVSLIVTLLCLPLYIVAENWQETERNIQKKLEPGIARIKTAFKGDEQYMILTTFYKQNHYHPIMALRSSFGLLIQIPFFMAAYSCLSHMQALQGESFLFIRDMGKSDCLFSICGFGINILPIAMTLINCISGTIYSKGHGVREKAQIYIMALLFLVILYDSPAGLVLYWTMNNVFSLIKNVFFKFKNPAKGFYCCVVVAIFLFIIYLLFISDLGPAKKLPVIMGVSLLLPVPLYIKLANYLLNKPLDCILKDNFLRFSVFAGSTLSMAVLLGILIPSTLISSSVQEFSNLGAFRSPSEFLPWSFMQASGIFIFWFFCIYFLFNKKIQALLSILMSGLLICSLTDTFLFSGNYGSMDVSLKALDGLKTQSNFFICSNLLIDILIFPSIVFIVKFKFMKILRDVSFGLLFIFIILSAVNTSKIKKEYTEFSTIVNAQKGNETSKKFSFSKDKKNVVVLMLDRFPAADFNEIITHEKEISNSFDGFTFYTNTVSFNNHTLMASPALYGGYEYTPKAMNEKPELTLKEKHNQALLLMPRIFTEQADFIATLSDTSWANYSYIADMSFADNYSDKIITHTLFGRFTSDLKKEYAKDEEFSLEDGLKRNLLYFGFFRTAPAFLRKTLYHKGTYLNRNAIDGVDKFLNYYSALHYMNDITDFSSDKSSFLMITNEATHTSTPSTSLDIINWRNLYHPDNDTYINQVTSLTAVIKFFNYLKENNVFDNTRIIIVSDHGNGTSYAFDFENPTKIENLSKENLNPLLAVKDFNETHPIKIDNTTFMTNADVPNIAFRDIIYEPRNPYTGKIVSSEEKENGVYITTGQIFMPYHSNSEYKFTVPDDSWYKINGNIFDAANWSK